MPDSNIPLQPEEPRPIPREEAQLNEQEAWTDPNDPIDEHESTRRPTYQRTTYQQPPYRRSPYGTPSQRRGWTSFGCLPTVILLLLLLCCVCNPLNTLFSTSPSRGGQASPSLDQLLYGY